MNHLTTKTIRDLVAHMSGVIIQNEVYFCELDAVAGDGDFGMSIAKGFKELNKQWESLSDACIGTFLRDCGMIVTEHCGGASGPIWGSAFRGAGKFALGKTQLDLMGFADMMQSAVDAIQKRGKAQLGDKTLLDALIPTVIALKESAQAQDDVKTALKKGAQAAVEGAEKTKTMVASRGRATYVGDRSVGYPDAGAMALGIIFSQVAQQVEV